MNLTDEQIIKALECCLNPDVISCKDIKCPFKKRCEKDGDALEKACLDLIKQKQEVNLLAAKEIVDLKIKIADQKAEIERYKHSIKLLEKDVADAKSDTVKEFAKFVIDKSVNGVVYASDIVDYVPEFLGR